mmetsp:Transcript_33687/g.95524  ORF Transcript_33687/g.95524 Transcript_33687/m.95524 type:complete len:340 (+) Transcript_33687:426-1445(+)
MRASSAFSSGLWSLDRSTARPARHSTARESPTFATTTRRGAHTKGTAEASASPLPPPPPPPLAAEPPPAVEPLAVEPLASASSGAGSLSTRATSAVLPTRLKAFLVCMVASIRPRGSERGRPTAARPSPPRRRRESIDNIARCKSLQMSWAGLSLKPSLAPVCLPSESPMASSFSRPSATSPVAACAGAGAAAGASATSAAAGEGVSSMASPKLLPLLLPAPPAFSRARFEAQAASTFGNSWEAMRETCAPPWPSKTAKRACSVKGSGREGRMHVASSMAGRQPCISTDAHSRPTATPDAVRFSRQAERFWPGEATNGCTSFAKRMTTVAATTHFRVTS